MDKKRRSVDSSRLTSGGHRPRSAKETSATKASSARRKNSFGGSTSKRTSSSRKSTSSVSTPPMDKVSMLVMEANEITQILKKDYEFTKMDETCKDEDQSEICVTNTQLKISCMWKLSKLKERLQRMRKLMYQSDPGIISDEVFYDPNDTWTRIDGNKEATQSNDKSTKEPSKTSRPSQLSIQEQKSKLGLFSVKSDDKILNEPSKSMTEPSPQEIPVKDTSPVRPVTLQSTGSRELPADSEFILSSLGTPTSPLKDSSKFLPSSTPTTPRREPVAFLVTPRKDQGPFLPEKYLRGNHSPPERDIVLSTSTPRSSQLSPPLKNRNFFTSGGAQKTPPKLSLKPAGPLKPRLTAPWGVTKRAVSLTQLRLKDKSSDCSLVDEVLRDCEALKLVTVAILERCTDQDLSKSQEVSELEESHMTCLQLMTSVELLTSHLDLWCCSLESSVDAPLVSNLTSALRSTLTELTAELIKFLQACDERNESVVQDAATRVLDHVYDLGKFCGELAIATDTSLTSLHDTDSTVNIDDLMKVTDDSGDLLRSRPGSDLKQACLTGADLYVDKTLDSALKGVKQCEIGLQQVALELDRAETGLSDLMRQSDMLVATCKILILRCQEVQTHMDIRMKEVEDDKPTNYFHHFYVRCQGVIGHVGSLVDSITYLERAFKPLAQGCDSASLRQLCRCSDMVRKAACKLAGLPADLTMSGSTAELKLIMQGISVLTDSQRQQLEGAAQDVKLSAEKLSTLSRKCISSDVPHGNVKSRRMLPVTPGASVVRRVTRSHSARGPNPNRRSMPAFPLDDRILTAR